MAITDDAAGDHSLPRSAGTCSYAVNNQTNVVSVRQQFCKF